MYLLTGNLSINRLYIIIGVVLLSTLPDFDFIIPGPHRAFSHSLVFCMLVTAAVGYLTPFTYLSVFSILLSHLLLDSFADGFNTVSWLWPYRVFHSAVSYNNIVTIIKEGFKVF